MNFTAKKTKLEKLTENLTKNLMYFREKNHFHHLVKNNDFTFENV